MKTLLVVRFVCIGSVTGKMTPLQQVKQGEEPMEEEPVTVAAVAEKKRAVRFGLILEWKAFSN